MYINKQEDRNMSVFFFLQYPSNSDLIAFLGHEFKGNGKEREREMYLSSDKIVECLQLVPIVLYDKDSKL